MLWEGVWEWTRLTKSKYISIEITRLSSMLTSIYTKGFHGLQATSCRLQARGGRLQATGSRLQARSNSKPGATSSRQQATG